MTPKHFEAILKRFDKRLFLSQEHGVYWIRRTELRMVQVVINGVPARVGFRNRNLAAAHRIMKLTHLGKDALYRLFRADSRRFSTITWLNAGERLRNDMLDQRLRSRNVEAAIAMRNQSRIISINT